MRFFFGRDSVISLESLKELVFPVMSDVDSWMPGVHELLGRAPRLETAMLLDWRGSHQNLDRITPALDIGRLRFLTVFVPLAYRDRYEVRRALIPKKTKMNTADTAICALDWTRRMLDMGTRFVKVVLVVNASSVVDVEGEGGMGPSAETERRGAQRRRLFGGDSSVSGVCEGGASERKRWALRAVGFLLRPCRLPLNIVPR
ncbi:hypothetical protein EDD85DRAFT_542307 [Armillaria nabsnona]|nr:hypothetical protein EDD85DRAFT_542307 [Armillaria nabsnona]